MKVEHSKVPLTEFEPGGTYRFSINGTPLYTAKVVKFHGGCWATVSVINCLHEPMKNEYVAGTEYDIKVATYNFEKVE